MTDATTALLIRARGYLERGWFAGYSAARDADGNPVCPTDARAIEWCINGALLAAGMPRMEALRHPARVRLRRALGEFGGSFVEFNNAQETVEPILAAFDRAIAAGSASDDRSDPAGRAIAAGWETPR